MFFSELLLIDSKGQRKLTLAKSSVVAINSPTWLHFLSFCFLFACLGPYSGLTSGGTKITIQDAEEQSHASCGVGNANSLPAVLPLKCPSPIFLS